MQAIDLASENMMVSRIIFLLLTLFTSNLQSQIFDRLRAIKEAPQAAISTRLPNIPLNHDAEPKFACVVWSLQYPQLEKA